MAFHEKYVLGRIRRRRFRTTQLEGWQCEEGAAASRPITLALERAGDRLSLSIPGERDTIKLGAASAAALRDGGAISALIGWPETIVIVRRDRVVTYAEGDPVHFGWLRLDGLHAIARTGYEYLSDVGAEVKLQLTLAAGGATRTMLLGPGDGTQHGPYTVLHDHSFDPSDRPSSLRHHGYALSLRRDASPAPPAPTSPVPLDVDRATTLIAIARQGGRLTGAEALLDEPDQFRRQLARYEGGRAQLEKLVRDHGPAAAEFRRIGETACATGAAVWRGEHGEPRVGRITLTLDAIGEVAVTREDGGAAPGRLRRHDTSPGLQVVPK
jgi:hypothetical protein